MSVGGPVDVRGTSTIALRSEVRARIGLLKTTERSESWIESHAHGLLAVSQTHARGVRARRGAAD